MSTPWITWPDFSQYKWPWSTTETTTSDASGPVGVTTDIDSVAVGGRKRKSKKTRRGGKRKSKPSRK